MSLRDEPGAGGVGGRAAGSRTRRRRSGPPGRRRRRPSPQQRRDRDDQLVADVVAERVVDLLEVVEVEQDQRPLGAVLPAVVEVRAQRRSRTACRLASPVSGSWSARCASCSACRTRSVTSTTCERTSRRAPVAWSSSSATLVSARWRVLPSAAWPSQSAWLWPVGPAEHGAQVCVEGVGAGRREVGQPGADQLGRAPAERGGEGRVGPDHDPVGVGQHDAGGRLLEQAGGPVGGTGRDRSRRDLVLRRTRRRVVVTPPDPSRPARPATSAMAARACAASSVNGGNAMPTRPIRTSSAEGRTTRGEE